jgi:hypothetical protein
MCARDVDSFLMGAPTSLPVTGGIVRRPARSAVPKVGTKKANGHGDMAHAAEAMKANTNVAAQA